MVPVHSILQHQYGIGRTLLAEDARLLAGGVVCTGAIVETKVPTLRRARSNRSLRTNLHQPFQRQAERRRPILLLS